MGENIGVKESIPESLPKICTTFKSPVPFQSVVQNINGLVLSLYKKFQYRNPIFTTGTIVDVFNKDGQYLFFGLTDSEFYLPAKMKKDDDNFYRLQNGLKVVAKGYFNLDSSVNKPFLFEIRLNVIEFNLVGSEFTELQNSHIKKSCPKNIKRICLITSTGSEAVPDFYKGLKKATYGLKVDIQNVNLLNVDSISGGIREADRNGYDVLIITRGGGSDLHLFNNPKILSALKECKTYTITAIGHADNTTESDKFSDLSLEAPTSAGVHIKNLISQKYFADKKVFVSANVVVPGLLQNPVQVQKDNWRFPKWILSGIGKMVGAVSGYFLIKLYELLNYFLGVAKKILLLVVGMLIFVVVVILLFMLIISHR